AGPWPLTYVRIKPRLSSVQRVPLEMVPVPRKVSLPLAGSSACVLVCFQNAMWIPHGAFRGIARYIEDPAIGRHSGIFGAEAIVGDWRGPTPSASAAQI